jgi:hypothetical protein
LKHDLEILDFDTEMRDIKFDSDGTWGGSNGADFILTAGEVEAGMEGRGSCRDIPTLAAP